MAFNEVEVMFKKLGISNRIIILDDSLASVELAANALGVIPARIAKTLAFYNGENRAILVVLAGDTKIDNRKFKELFKVKSKMLSKEDLLVFTKHEPGGVCPFGIENLNNVDIYLDESLQRFTTVFPACGSINSAIEFSLDELQEFSKASAWIDIGKR